MVEEEVIDQQIDPNQDPISKVKSLYKAVANTYDVGDFDNFSKNLQDESKRKSFYDLASKKYDLGTYDDFTSKIIITPEKKNLGGKELQITESQSPYTKQIDFTSDPISLARQSAELKKSETVTAEPALDMSGMPVESATQTIYDQDKIKASDDVAKHLKSLGYGQELIDKISDLPKGYENDPIYGNAALSKLLESNPEKFERAVSSLKWQAPLASAMQNRINQIRDTKQPDAEKLIDEIKNDNNTFINLNASTADPMVKQNDVKTKIDLIHKYVQDTKEQEKLIRNITTDSSINFGSPEELSYWDKNRIGNLNPQQSLALNFLDKTDSDKAKAYRDLVLNVDESKVLESGWATKAFNKNLKELEELGNTLVLNNASENYNDLLEKAKQNGGVLTPEEIAQAQHFKSALENSQFNIKNLKNIYQDVGDEDIDVVAQNLVGQRSGGIKTFASTLLGSLAKTGKSISDIVSYPFQSAQADNLDVLNAVGLTESLKPYTTTTEDKNLYSNTEIVVDKDLQKKINAIKDDPNLSASDKVDKAKYLLKSNPSAWKQEKTEGKFNVGINAITSSFFQMAANIAPYIALEAAAGGGATPGLIRQISTTLGAVAATSYTDELAAAAERKDPNPRLTALENVAINAMAYTVGGAPAKIREAAGTKTAIGKIINKLDDATIEKILSNPPKKLADYLKRFTTTIAEQTGHAVKSAVPFQATIAAKDILQGATVDEDFVKSQLAQGLNFAIFSGVVGTALGLKNLNKEQKEMLYLAGKNSEEALNALEIGVKNGTISKSSELQIRDNIERAKKVYENVPMIDAKGNKLSDNQSSDLMYLKLRESFIQESLKKDIAPELKEKLELQLREVQNKVTDIYKGGYEPDISKPIVDIAELENRRKEQYDVLAKAAKDNPDFKFTESFEEFKNNIDSDSEYLSNLYDQAKPYVPKGSLTEKEGGNKKSFIDYLSRPAQVVGRETIQPTPVPKEVFNPIVNKIKAGIQKLSTKAKISVLKGKNFAKSLNEAIKTGNVNLQSWGGYEKRGFEESPEYKKLIDDGTVKLNFDIKGLEGKPVVVINPDNMLTGDIITKNGKTIVSGNGGINFVTKFGDVWASSDNSTANTLAKYINEARQKDIEAGGDGTIHVIVTKGDLSKSLTSHTGAKAAMKVLEHFVDKKLISLADFRKALIEVGKKYNIDFDGRMDAQSIHDDISKKFFGVNDSTFSKRGFFVQDMIDNLAKNSKSAKDNIVKIRELLNTEALPKSTERKTGDIGFAKEGIIDAIGHLLSDDMTVGVKNSEAYATIEIKHPVKVVDLSGKEGGHESYPFHLQQIDENGNKVKPVLNVLNKSQHVTDILNDANNNAVEKKGGAGKFGSNQIGMAKGFVKPAAEHPTGVNMMTDATGKIYGFEQNGKIVLNADLMNGNTPFHEAGHLWLSWAKENRSDLHDAGMDKIENSKYLSDVKNNPVYQENAAKLPESEREAYFKAEALAKAIGDNGEKFVTEAEKADFKQWLKDLWQTIATHFGLTDMTAKQISDMTLDDFSKKVAADIIDTRSEAEKAAEAKEEPKVETEEEPDNINLPPDADPDLIKMANAVGDEFVKNKFGLDALDTVISKLQDTDLKNIIQKVKDAVAINKNLIKDRVKSIIEMKSGSEFDQALLMYDLAELKGREQNIKDQILTETDPKKIAELQQNLMNVYDEMQDNALANHILGRTASTIFRLRQVWVNKELTIQDMREQYKVSKGIKDLTKEQEAEIDAAYKTIKEAQENLDKAKKELESLGEENARLFIENEKLKELQEQAEKNKKSDRAKKVSEKIDKSQERVKKSLDNLKKLGGQATAGFDPKIAIELSKIAAEKVYQGVIKFDQLVKDVYDDIKDVLPNFTKEDVINHLLYTVNKKGELEPTLLSEKYNELKKSKDKKDETIRAKVKAYEDAQKQMALKQFQWQQDRRGDMMSKQPINKRVIDGILQFQRFNVLSYPSTFVKLMAAVAHAAIYKPLIKQPIAFLTNKITPKSWKENRTTWGDPSFKSLGAYYSAFIKNFSAAALSESFKGIDTKEMLYGKRGMYDEFNVGSGILEMPGRSHGYIKSFIKNAEFAYAHEQQLIYNMTKMSEIQKKLDNKNLTKEQRSELKSQYKEHDVTNPVTLDRINRMSLEHGKWAILMNDSKATQTVNKILNGNKFFAPILKSELPIVKIPINFVGRALAIKYGFIRSMVGNTEWMSKKFGGAQFPGIIELIYKGADNLTEQQANLLGKSMQLGTLGTSFFVLGYLNAKNITKDEDGNYEVFGKTINKNLMHTPEMESILSGAETAEKYHNDESFVESYAEAEIDMIKNNPFVNFFQYGALPKLGQAWLGYIASEGKALKEGKGKHVELPVGRSMDIISKKIADMATAGFIKQTATSFDTEEGKGFHPFGTTIKRYPAGETYDRFLQTLQINIPGLRQNVPTTEESKSINEFKKTHKGNDYKEVRQEYNKAILEKD